MFPSPGECDFLFEIEVGFVPTHDDIHRSGLLINTGTMTSETKVTNITLNDQKMREVTTVEPQQEESPRELDSSSGWP